MPTVNQIYTVVNDSAKAALGTTAITAVDTATFLSLGNQVLSSNTNREAYYNALVDRMAQTAIAVREYEADTRAVKRDEMEWGIIYQKISFKQREAVENPSWNTTTQADPFDVEIQTEPVQKLFSKMGTYSYEDSIPDYQLFTAFTSATAMGAFISGIYTNMHNAMSIAEDNLANLAVSTYIAGVLKKGKATQKRNLMKEFYTTEQLANTTIEMALKDSAFLKYASREINLVTKKLKKMSTLYNAEDIPRHTPNDKLVVEILAEFSTATASYLESDTYHKDLVALPNYEEVAYWQGAGTSNDLDDVSSINITNTDISSTAVTQKGIIAFVHDYDAVASIIYRRRSGSMYNPRAERYNIFEKADKGYAIDLSENGVVFYLDPSEASSGVAAARRTRK